MSQIKSSFILSIFFIVMSLCPTLLFSTTPPFVLNQAFSQASGSGQLEGTEIESLFTQTAHLSAAKKNQVQLSSSSPAFGYRTTTVCYAAPLPFGVIGLGYQWFGAGDNYQTVRSSINSRPDIASTFSNVYDTLQLSYSYAFTPRFSVGLSASRLGVTLASANAQAFSLDFSAKWQPNSLIWLGIYTKQLLATPLNWSNSSTSDSLPIQTVGMVGTHLANGWIQLASDGAFYQAEAAWTLHPMCTIFANVLNQNLSKWNRIGAGVSIQCFDFSLTYRHEVGLQTDLTFDQDLVQLIFNF